MHNIECFNMILFVFCLFKGPEEPCDASSNSSKEYSQLPSDISHTPNTDMIPDSIEEVTPVLMSAIALLMHRNPKDRVRSPVKQPIQTDSKNN